MHLRRWRVGFERERSARASAFHSPGSRRAAVEAPWIARGCTWTRSSGSQRWRPSQRLESARRRSLAPWFLSRTLPSDNAAICLQCDRTTYIRLHPQNADLIPQFWALMKVPEQWSDLLSKSLLELYLKLSFKQHLSNPSAQKYFILLWELYIFPSSKRYKI